MSSTLNTKNVKVKMDVTNMSGMKKLPKESAELISANWITNQYIAD